LRRQHEPAEALFHDLIAIECPICFTSDRTAAIKRVQSARDDALPNGDIDPLFRRRRDLTFATGVKYNDDFLVYEEIINELHEAGQHVRGIRLRVLVGELMNAETTAFWERYGWTPAAQAEALRCEITAFLPARSATVTDTSGPW